jgi:hypothetical protein
MILCESLCRFTCAFRSIVRCKYEIWCAALRTCSSRRNRWAGDEQAFHIGFSLMDTDDVFGVGARAVKVRISDEMEKVWS